MTLTVVILAAVPVLIVVSPLLFAGWLEWQANRPGGASDYHVRRLRELARELGDTPVRTPVTLSWNEAVRQVNQLESRLESKKKVERLREECADRLRRSPET